MSDNPRILVVDDDAGVRLLVRAALSQADLSVVEVADGEAAVASLDAGLPDLVLLDVHLPGRDGFSVCRHLRALPDGDLTPVLMLTSSDDSKSIDNAFEAGATDFITKPVNWQLLRYRIRYALRAADAAQGMRAGQRRLANAQRIARIGDWEWDVRRERLHLSAQACEIFGYAQDEWSGDLSTLVAAATDDASPSLGDALKSALDGGTSLCLDHRIELPDGTQRIVQQHIEPIGFAENGRVTRLAGTVQDVTQRKEDEEKIRRLAYFDTLTGLPNRFLFNEHLRFALASAQRHGRRAALMFLDLDDFKWVNDTLGHTAGDELLRGVGGRLTGCVRGFDGVGRNTQASIARLGGDEFTVIVTDLDRATDADLVAQRILDAMAMPFSIAGEDIFASVSIGIAIFPDDGPDVDSLLMSADAAMYRAKGSGRNNYRSFDSSMHDDARRSLSYGSALRHAIERGELRLQYQPKMTVAAGHLTGVEALVRWAHPDGVLMPPGDFLPIAEHTGLIVPIGEWAIDAALRQLRTWQDLGMPVMRVALNLSARQLRERNFADRVMQLLDRHRLPPSSLELEVTESAVMEESEACVKTLTRLAALGIEFAIDDFGTGASSLSFLKRLPLKTLKIDRTFVQNLTQDRDDAKIVRAIVALGHSLGLVVVAEGVETLGQLEVLSNYGCDQYQGRLFSGAVDAGRISALMNEAGMPLDCVQPGNDV